jgi:hypothetical protein
MGTGCRMTDTVTTIRNAYETLIFAVDAMVAMQDLAEQQAGKHPVASGVYLATMLL